MGNTFCTAYGVPPPPINRKHIKYKVSFLLKISFNLKNLGISFSLIKSLKKIPTRKYNSVAPIVVEMRTNEMPHHLPKTKPAKIKRGMAKPKKRTQTMQKKKNATDKNKKFSFLYSKIVSLFDLIKS